MIDSKSKMAATELAIFFFHIYFFIFLSDE